jgi:L-lactate dehydrogenase complex protein LldE
MTKQPRIGLFVTCLANLFRPSVCFAAVSLLERAGCAVEVPEAQVCCGQPALNSGDRDSTCALARQVIAAFEGFDYVVAPSGSCIGTLRHDYPELLAGDAAWEARARALADRSFELTSFLTDVRKVASVDARFADTVTYHDSCSGLRDLGIQAQPRALLSTVQGLSLRELRDGETCCGFGGTFCVKYPEISSKIVSDKVRNVVDTGAGTLLGGDLGCLLNIAGRLRRLGSATRVFHVAEVLAGMADGPGIAEER